MTKLTKEQLKLRLHHDIFTRSNGYDPNWVLENLMGPNVLWLAEALSQVMHFVPGMRVLDMGCGKAISSIFLAREFGMQAWANDLWISASENWARICGAGMQDHVFPIHAEAHDLPYADGFFDALVSLDAYHYFGTNDLYIGYYSRFVRPGGEIGMVVPGLLQEFEHGLPEHLAPYWDWEFGSFHSPTWWRNHWEKTGKVEVLYADSVPEGWKQWLLWLQISSEAGLLYDPKEAAMLETDAGRNLGFTRIVGKRI